ncbi:UNVERIFIED_CONTAM: hypothetical protein GTU68_019780 [Idotea baltica]|nr:hypothetical protein [Idotea baltica]
MNAAVRAVVRAGVYYKLELVGIKRGYQGIIENDFHEMNARSVSNIIQRGGTILKSARSDDFRTEDGRRKAHQNLKDAEIDAIVAIGGDGTFTGAKVFYEEFGFPIVGIPGTIDNDLTGTDYTLGYDTATNTALRAIDAIKDTASSHSRLFFVEVMGRDTGFIALRTAVSGGAEAAMLPEKMMTIDELIDTLNEGSNNAKTSSVVIVAEGNPNGSATEIAYKVGQKDKKYSSKVTILGHTQRGGTPSCYDRLLASKLGVWAIEALMKGKKDVMVGDVGGELTFTPFKDAIEAQRKFDEELFRISKILAI